MPASSKRGLASSTAFCTFSTSGPAAEPFVENERYATRGSLPVRSRYVCAVAKPMSTSCSAVGCRGLEIEDEAARRRLDALLRAERVECRAKHVAGGGNRTCDKAVDAAELHHHAAEVDALRAESLLRASEVDDLLLLGRLLRLLGVPRLEIRGFELRVAQSVVNRLDAAFGQAQLGRLLCRGDFLGSAEDNRRRDLAVDASARGSYDARVHALGENDRSVQLRGLFNYVLDCVHLCELKS